MSEGPSLRRSPAKAVGSRLHRRPRGGGSTPKARSGAGSRAAATRSGAAGVVGGNRTDLGVRQSEGSPPRQKARRRGPGTSSARAPHPRPRPGPLLPADRLATPATGVSPRERGVSGRTAIAPATASHRPTTRPASGGRHGAGDRAWAPWRFTGLVTAASASAGGDEIQSRADASRQARTQNGSDTGTATVNPSSVLPSRGHGPVGHDARPSVNPALRKYRSAYRRRPPRATGFFERTEPALAERGVDPGRTPGSARRALPPRVRGRPGKSSRRASSGTPS